VGELFFDFAPTAKNGPLQSFFGQLLEALPTGPFVLRSEQIERRCPPLYHRVVEIKQEKLYG
jgi:hypothetical protein